VSAKVPAIVLGPWWACAPSGTARVSATPAIAGVEKFPQTNDRLVPASERLYRAIVEKRLTHPDDPELNAHVAATVARDTRRGWRIDKLESRQQIDGVTALAMAVERAERRPEPVRLLGWL
jgi:phage terminase large subunit-like protein